MIGTVVGNKIQGEFSANPQCLLGLITTLIVFNVHHARVNK